MVMKPRLGITASLVPRENDVIINVWQV